MLKHQFPEFFQRVNYKASLYFDIAYKQFITDLNPSLQLDKNSILELENFKDNLFANYHIVVVFSAMTLEAFVNDYLAVCLSDDFFYSNLDKLKIKQKIEVIYNIIWEIEFDKSEKLYNCIHNLIKERNEFVHSKSENFNSEWFEKNKKNIPVVVRTSEDNDEQDYIQHYLRECKQRFIESYNAINTLYLFCKAVDSNDENCHATVDILSHVATTEIRYQEIIKSEIDMEMKRLVTKIRNL